MRHIPVSAACVAGVLTLASSTLLADVRSDQRVRFQLGGAVGKIVNIFGGTGAREGTASTVAVKGNRKATMSDTAGQIIDLSEEKVYDLDVKRKTYTVTTFAEMRKELEEAQRQAEQSAREERSSEDRSSEPATPEAKDPNAREYEVDFDLKNTGASRTINGFATRQTVVTVTVREKGKTLNDAGGMVMTADLWTAPDAPSTKELAEFDRKYAEKIFGPVVSGASPQDMAMALAMYPQIKPALDKLRAQGSSVEGTAILTEIKMEAVPPGTANQTAESLPPAEEPKKKGLGGMLGGLRKMAEQAQKGNSNSKPQRAIIMTTSVEMEKLTTDVDAAAVALPEGFTQKK